MTCSCYSDDCLHNDPDFEHGSCEYCGSPLAVDHSGVHCPECEPRVSLEYSPVRASFAIVDGVVTWSGWCTDEIAIVLEEHDQPHNPTRQP
jgi:hypothetical protein